MVGIKQPEHLDFQASGHAYLLACPFQGPEWMTMQFVPLATARAVVRTAEREKAGFAGLVRKTFTHSVGDAFHSTEKRTPIDDVLLKIERKQMYLIALGAADGIPTDIPAMLAAHTPVTAKPVAYTPVAAPVAPGKTNAWAKPLPQLADRLPDEFEQRVLIVMQGLGKVDTARLGEHGKAFAQMMASEGTPGLLAGLLIGFLIAQTTGPVAIALDAGVLAFGLYALKFGIFAFIDKLAKAVTDIRQARDRKALADVSQALAELLVEFGINTVVAILTKGAAKRVNAVGKGGGGSAATTAPPPQQSKPAASRGWEKTDATPPAPKPATTGPVTPPATKPVLINGAKRDVPMGFKDKAQFDTATRELQEALRASGIDDATIGVRGSSVTGQSFARGTPFGPKSDIDMFIESKKLTDAYKPSKNIPGFVHPGKILPDYPKLEAWSNKWTRELGREITPGGFQPGTIPSHPAILVK